MDAVHHGGVAETFLLTDFRPLDQGSGGVMTQPLGRRYADGVIGPFGSLAPRKGEIEVMTGRPRQRLGAEIGHRELAGQAERLEPVGDDEFVLIGVAGAGLLARDKDGIEAAGVEPGDLNSPGVRSRAEAWGAVRRPRRASGRCPLGRSICR